MATVTVARKYVASPPFTPLPYGLFSVTDATPDSDQHWQAGVEYQPDVCGEALSTWDECVITGSGTGTLASTKQPVVTGIGTKGAEPFTVYSWIRCGPVGQDEIEARTISALTNGEARAVERVFWTGVVDSGQRQLQHLASNSQVVDVNGDVLVTAATSVTTGTAVDMVEGLGLLEGQLAACYGGVGVIHMPRTAIPHMAWFQQLRESGQQLRTPNGNIIAAYSSNNTEGPNGSAAPLGQTWIYGTGMLMYRRSQIMVTTLKESLDRSENNLVIIAERTYDIGWDCCHFAAQVSLPGA